MGDAAKKDEFTPEERAQIRVLLELLKRAEIGVDVPKPPTVVRKDREPPAEAFDRVMKRRKRRRGAQTNR